MIAALIFINVYALGIALLIIFCDRVISNYGKCKIVINNDKEFETDGGKSLLKTLFENKYFIPSACGGKGTCGYCKLQVEKGGGGVLPTEALVLTPREIRENYRMACQVKVREDMLIHIPPEYLSIKEYDANISMTKPVTSDIKKIRIALGAEDNIEFKAGQYVQVRFDGPDGVDYRAYSIASNPDKKDEIELNV